MKKNIDNSETNQSEINMMNRKSYYAHSKNEDEIFQYLIDHLSRVARITADFINHPELKKVGHLAGLLHDIGKIHPDFQNKLINETNERVDHKGLGVGFANKFTSSEFLCKIIAAHHGGLTNNASFRTWWKGILESGKIYEVTNDALELIKQLGLPTEDIQKIENEIKIQKDLAIRMVFSALVDADFLDTENHFNPEKATIRKPIILSTNHWEYFQKYHKSLKPGNSNILYQLRNDIYQSCVEKAKNESGFFRLTVPTGGGKTLSSLGFALQHAQINKQNRIIYAIPFTSIVEQIAEEFKKIFPPENILEHHTGIHAKDSDEYEESNKWNRLASENWDAPIIITTTVQLFESLLARSTSKCRKLHNIQNSVIILDEVQTLPLHLLPTIMSVVKDLVLFFNVTVVFCTATQPALDEFLKSDKQQPLELAPNPEHLFHKLERVHYRNYSNEKWDWKKIAEEIKNSERVMAVVNTKKDALELWRTLDDKTIYHLSSAMCGAHRRDTLTEIRKKLKEKEECKLVATQVIEAGVDVDFDKVLRAIGPLDRIVQAAGRCNREGNNKKGEVIIFNPKDGHFPKGEYGSALHSASQLLNNPDIRLDLNDPKTFPDYFSKLYQNIQLDPKGIEKNRKNLKFEYVSRDFKMIDDDSVSIIVNYKPKKDEIRGLLDQLKRSPQEAKQIIRNLQPFMVSIPPWEFNNNQTLILEVFPYLYYWIGRYDAALGLLKEYDITNLVQ